MTYATRSRNVQERNAASPSATPGKVDDDIKLDDGRKPGQWGRAWEVDSFTLISICFILVFCLPITFYFYFYVSCTHYDCAVAAPIVGIVAGDISLAEFWNQFPPITADGFITVALWMSIHIFLSLVPDFFHKFIPGYVGGIHLGQGVTPAGKQLLYKINGLQSFVITNGVFVLNGLVFQWVSPTYLFDHWGEALWAANALGYLVSILVFIKAHIYPSEPKDCKFTGYFIYDFMMGIELNPRIGQLLDLKMFFNTRPGMQAWSVINMSNALYQYHTHGYVTNSMWIVNILQFIYCADTPWNEHWYTGTFDIIHDHFGFYFAWGDCVWLPWMYTLQTLYLAYHPIDLPVPVAFALLILGLTGLVIYRGVNTQREYFRRTDGQGLIWGAQPKYLDATYYTGDGRERKTKILLSGGWGLARHFNYTGELMMSTACCLACGFQGIMPYLYLSYVLILMTHRCFRDEHRCKNKYGKAWDEYTSKFPYRYVPGVF